MSTQFKNLFSVTVEHDFYNSHCQDFEFLIPAETQAVLRNGKILCRERDGILHGLYEASESGSALHDLSGQNLRFGLKLTNPYFNNFTQFSLAGTPLYRNQASLTALDAAQPVNLAGAILQHHISDNERPVTLRLLDAGNNQLQLETITAAHNRDAFSFDLTRLPDAGQASPGLFQVSETYSGSSSLHDYYFHPEFNRQAVFGVLDITIGSGFYTAPAALTIGFSSRQDTLKYYLITKNYSDAEFAQLSVSDAGFAEESRPQINFTRVASGAFTVDELSSELLGEAGDKIALFKSSGLVSRQQTARKKIQLSRNGDVLISDLPAPGSDRARADLFIHVVKP